MHPQPESYWGHVNPVGPRGVYDEAKRFAEALTMAYRRTHGVDTGIVRIFNTYGPRMRPDDGRAIPTFIRQALAGEPITVAGDGSQTRSVCYVDDLVDGILRLAGSDLAGPVNIGNPGEFSVLALAELIREAVGSAARRSSSSRGRRTTRPYGSRTSRWPGRRWAGSRSVSLRGRPQADHRLDPRRRGQTGRCLGHVSPLPGGSGGVKTTTGRVVGDRPIQPRYRPTPPPCRTPP